MIETAAFEEVTQFKLSTEMDGKPVYWAAAYLVDGLLIDTGPAVTAVELAAALADKRVDKIVNTHFHEDHVGANNLIAKQHGASIFAPAASIPHIQNPPPLRLYQKLVWGEPEPSSPSPLPDTVKTPNFTFSVIPTPGHSEGHVCLAELSRGWIFSGDIFARETPKFTRPEEDMGQAVASMRTLVNLPTDRLVLFTSVGKIIEDGRGALTNTIEYLTGLSRQAKSLVARGRSPEQIMDTLFGGEHNFATITNGHYRTMNLVKSLLEMEE
ncbi:MAG: MBL fold metallo-hydrolase [Deltaproteobacteria bacterium]|nr:MBL fold metallo-hydrolase [Deltaproteobacteria bacterium]